MAQPLRIYYCGIDERYFRRIQEELKEKYPKEIAFTFEKSGVSAFQNSQALLRNMIEFSPDILYFDFSGKFDDVFRIAVLYNRLKLVEKVVKIGLFSMSEYEAMTKRGIYIGLHGYFLKKGEESEDAIYAALTLAVPKLVVKPNFFNKTIVRGLPVTVLEVVRIGYLSDEGMRFETSLPLAEGEPINIQHALPEEHVPSLQCQVAKVESGPLYYNSKHAGIVRFEFVDLIEAPERQLNKVDQAHFNDKVALRDEEVEKKKQSYLEWKGELKEESRPKRVKMIIVDPTLETMNSYDTLLWDSVFSFRIQIQIYENTDDLNRFRPNFIAFQLGKSNFLQSWEEANEQEGIKEEDKKIIPEVSLESVQKVIEALKDIPEISPFILIFNCSDMDSEKAREVLGYPKLIASKEPISTQKIVDISKVFDKKGQFFQQKVTDEVYLSKMDPRSFAYRPVDVKILNVTEFELHFESELKIPYGTLMKANKPSSFYFTVVPVDESSPYKGQSNVYRGLIHSQNREELNLLRKYVIKKD